MTHMRDCVSAPKESFLSRPRRPPWSNRSSAGRSGSAAETELEARYVVEAKSVSVIAAK